ncbi:MAG: amino acid adenylation domain-containing protein, partial [Gammaproteobacteria bacterium]|nr:amino acid adenylation domain-containing protein [Gammaproteobacteria bacterium]
DEQTEKRLADTLGIRAISTETGIEAFSRGLCSERSQFMVLEGYRPLVRKGLGIEAAVPSAALCSKAPSDTGQLLEKLQKDILSMSGAILRVSAKDIDPNDDISEYGFDSISFTEFANRLNDKYQLETTPAIFFEYPSASALAQFLCSEYQDSLSVYYSDNLEIVSPPSPNLDSEPEVRLKSRFIEQGAKTGAPGFSAGTPMAIIGMSGVMPQSADLESFWQHLEAGDDLITEVPPERWDWQACYGDPTAEANKTKAKWGGFMPAVDKFDPLFFGISPREAELMDPQQRLFLETVWKTIEDAGYKASDLSGSKTGLFVGVATHDYDELLRENAPGIEAHGSTGMAHSILANRVSYLLNLHGPSEPVDTACSSSLVAIHRAVEAIRSGACDMAIAGGVNVMLTPALTLSFSKAGMLSDDGRCKTFDKRANGYVRGEGVGAIWLKPLEKAQADGDLIYAVVKGTAENHGGRATSLTAPNPNAQAQLLISAFDDAQVDPGTISYIEAHGTGTGLGDPVEINGLKNAFAELYKKSGKPLPEKPYCGIGSVKTNIGHLETAAGIAGVLKVLLAMKHKTLPGLLHFSELNPYIQLQDSPFYLVTDKQTWTPLTDAEGQKTPRRAGVSSFGFGGANAHVVLEEYDFPLPPAAAASNQLIVLSAKNDERLKACVQHIIDFLEKQPDILLSNIAYTLQAGREAMTERLAMAASSVDDLKEKLTQYIQGQTETDAFYRGNVKTSKTQSGLLVEGEAGEAFLRIVIEKKELAKLAQLWVSGVDIDWQLLYPNQKPQRISLPTYPFARERYWIPAKSQMPFSGNRPELHPLIDQVDLKHGLNHQGVVFQKTLNRMDLIVKDHQVREKPILPGVGYLEMAYAAARLVKEDTRFKLARVVWQQPLAVLDDAKEVQIVITDNQEQLTYQIQSRDGIHAAGEFHPDSASPEQRVDIEEIKAGCSRHIEKERLYNSFQANDIRYGAYFQGVREVWGSASEALGRLELPKAFAHELSHYTLHPALMDSALQTIAGLGSGLNFSKGQPFLPFSVEEVEIIHPFSAKMYAYVKASGSQRFQVALLDETGLVCLKLHDFSLRALPDPLEHFFYAPRWISQERKTAKAEETATACQTILIVYPVESPGLEKALAACHPHDEIRFIQLGTANQQLAENHREVDTRDALALERCIEPLGSIHVIYYLGGIQPGNPDIDDLDALEASQERGVLSLFRLIKALSQNGFTQKPLQLNVITNDVFGITSQDVLKPFAAGLYGLTKAIDKEYPRITLRSLDLSLKDIKAKPTQDELNALVSPVLAEADIKGEEAAFRNGKRYVRSLSAIKLPAVRQTPFKHQGVYLILGGAGGIGLCLSRHLAKTVQARLILTGRSELSSSRLDTLREIESQGAQVLYLRADATDLSSMQTAVEKAKSRFGQINGVIHSAIVLRDKTIDNMDEDDFRAATDPKVIGSVILHKALQKVLQNEPLDFMMFFSSAQSFSGNAGQSNYAAGCTFKDAFARALSRRHACPVKIINWGYWGGAGIAATEEYRQRFAARGIQSIEPREGMEAVERILTHRVTQIMPIKAEAHALEKMGIDRQGRIELYPVAVPSLFEALASQIKRPPVDTERFSHAEKAFNELTQFGRQLLLEAFQRLGVFQNGGEHYETEKLAGQLNIVPAHARLFEALLDILEQAGFAGRAGSSIITAKALDNPELRQDLKSLEEKRHHLAETHPDMAAHVRLLRVCLSACPDILTGKRPATDIMFPHSSMELVEGVYKGNASADYFNQLAVQSVRSYIQARLPLTKPHEKIKILEVGAGTGGTSALVLEAIETYREHLSYIYTDISVGFIQYGKQHYGQRYPFVDFSILNIETDVKAQGYELGDFDVIIAANVLHATRNMQYTIRNTKALLKTHGCLILNEVTSVQTFATLTFGLLEGWWLFEDVDRRLKGSPLLNAKMWERLLEEEGFEHVMSLGQPDQNGTSPQHIIIAESNGEVWHQAAKPIRQEQRSVVETAKPASVITTQISDSSKVMAKTAAMSAFEMPTPQAVIKNEDIRPFIEGQIAESLSGVLQIDQHEFDMEASYTDFGVDSILAVEIINRLNEKLAIQLRTTDLFNYPTIRQLIDHIIDEFGHAIDSQEHMNLTSSDGLFKMQPEVQIELDNNDGGFKKANSNLHGHAEPSTKAVAASNVQPSQAIAIIGMSGKFPDANDVNEYWDNLSTGKDSVREIPETRWSLDEFYDPDAQAPQKSYSKWGGFLSDIDQFDPLFFNISPKEAELMDPQQRLFLQEAWQALEDAGYSPSAVSNKKCGVFVGCSSGDYQSKLTENQVRHDAYSLMGNAASVLAARISYFLNLKGPNVAIDTACSSSLVAIHLACESIHSGTSELALAGGVSISTTGEFHILASKAGMLSPSGKCHTFDNRANGFATGEGVGVVVLKPLADALNDGNPVYGVIKGSGVNQDGKTNGITAPSVPSQTLLECEVYSQYHIHPDTISYVEAHGTGTQLGDPIEVQALTDAFRKYTNKTQYCAIGSVKTNIGHALMAAGIAGLIKLLLCLKHKKLVPSLNLEVENEHINFKNSPFYVNTEFKDWKTEPGAARRAAISSFGFSGTNAHLVIEEYENPPSFLSSQSSQLAVLSAKNEARLQAYAKKIIKYLCDNSQEQVRENTTNQKANLSLADLAYTLQAGREAMTERLAMAVSSVDDLKDKLTRYIQGQIEIENFYRGNVKTNKAQLDLLIKGKAGEAFLKILIEEKELTQLAQLWISGVEIDWQLLYPNQKPQRISLPTYPFARERYWIPISKHEAMAVPSQIAKLHPLLGSNTSTFGAQKFTTQLSGEEFYLTDHLVAEQKTLPGVAYLEMARAAGESAGGQTVSKLSNIVWAKPITVSATPKSVHISLSQVGQQVEFEVTSLDDQRQRQVHAQGKLTYGSQENSETVDIEAVQSRCSEIWSHAECYQLFQTAGLNYGPGFQTIQALYRNETEALSHLQLVTLEGFNDFVLHPSLMDGALQTVAGLMDQSTTVSYLPFALGEVELLRPLTSKSYALVRGAEPSADSSLKKFNVFILDEAGFVSVRLKDFSVRAVKQPVDTPVKMYCQSVWETSQRANHEAPTAGTVLLFDVDDSRYPSFKARMKTEVILVTPGENYQKVEPQIYTINPSHPADYQKLLTQTGLPGHVIHLWSQTPFDSAALNAQTEISLFSIFHLSQALLEQKPVKPVQLLYVYLESKGALQPQYAAVSGFAKSIRLENSKLSCKTLALPSLDKNLVLSELQTPEIEVRYDDKGQRQIKALQEFDGAAETPSILKENGIYLITGGTGGLGLIFAEYLARHFRARLVLTGRSELTPEQTDNIQSFNSLGAEVIYLRADIGKRDEVTSLIAQTKSHFGKLNGIIHSAGVIKNALMRKKTPDEMADVLAPKVYGTIYLDEFTQNEPLDFLVLFSSMAAVMGNMGQCDYAYANSFMDNFALWRCEQKRFGKTLSINWPLWQNGGMQVDEQTKKWLNNTMGMQALSAETGLEAFSRGLTWKEKSQFLVMEGYRPKLRRVLGLENVSRQTTQVSADQSQVLEKLQKDLLSLASAILKLEEHKIDLNENLEKYGFESIGFLTFANQINEQYQLELTPTLFFEYASIAALSQFLCKEYPDRFRDSDQEMLVQASELQSTSSAPEPAETVYPLSRGQQALWFLYQLAPDSVAYNTALTLRIRSTLEASALQNTFQALINRHPCLRTTLTTREGKALQEVHQYQTVRFEQADVSTMSWDDLNKLVVEACQKPFELEQGPLLRVNLFTRGSNDHILLLTVHHIVFDAWSLWMLVEELGILYPVIKTGRQASLPAVKHTYADFVRWQRDMLATAKGERLRAYWQEQLAGELPVINLPTDHPRPPVQTYQGASVHFFFTEALTQQLKELASTEGASLYMILLATYQILLYRYTGQEDILVGSATSGRTKSEFADIAGYFVNMVVLRAKLQGSLTFKTFLGQVRQTVLGALDHQDYPFPLLVERLQPERDPSRSPLFQVDFVLQKPQQSGEFMDLFTPGETGVRVNLGELELEPFEMAQQEGQFDLSLDMMEVKNSLTGTFKYNTDLFEAATINRMAGHFRILLEGIAANPLQPIHALPLLTEAEQQQLQAWNDTATDYPRDKTIVDLFEQQVEKTPSNIAAVFENQQLTYQQLNEKANQLAHHLLTLKPQAGISSSNPLIAIAAERSLEMVIGLLGVLKAGGAYVPIDPGYPAARIQYMLEDSAAPLLLTQSLMKVKLSLEKLTPAGVVICLDEADFASQPLVNPDINRFANDLAYVIYTSGSTGRPKGVMIEHQALLNHTHWMQSRFAFTAEDKILQKTPFSFDASVWEFYAPLLTGGTLVLAKPHGHADINYLFTLLNQKRITVLQLVPSLLKAMLEENEAVPDSLRYLFCGGEALSQETHRKFYSQIRNAGFYNLYGPTEACIDATCWESRQLADISIGRPVANTRIYILDARHQPQPPGIPGELCIAGAGLARGYLNRPELTAEKFMEAELFGKTERIYKTGDLARWLPDGNLEYLGRIDFQVKLRGFRIELGEIEAVFSQHEAVKEAVVIVYGADHETNGNKRLAAYLTAAQESNVELMELKDWLKARLP